MNNKSFILSASFELLADLETPVSTFYKLCDKKPYSFLLESVEGNEKIGRYSLIGTEPILVFTNKDNKTTLKDKSNNEITELDKNPFTALKDVLKKISLTDNNDFIGFIGYFGYENIRWIEPKTNFTAFKKAPDACLILPGKLVIFDHILHKVNLISLVLVKDKNELEKKQSEVNEKLKLVLFQLKNIFLFFHYLRQTQVKMNKAFYHKVYKKY